MSLSSGPCGGENEDSMQKWDENSVSSRRRSISSLSVPVRKAWRRLSSNRNPPRFRPGSGIPSEKIIQERMRDSQGIFESCLPESFLNPKSCSNVAISYLAAAVPRGVGNLSEFGRLQTSPG